ncbi:MAG: hypothetical protein CM1200mP2_10560 [Planctomycetaceae bacterium]|nr:MAG: hypothetical protein CM1200mP2_10560 [Planctomycetaceae bacterium]
MSRTALLAATMLATTAVPSMAQKPPVQKIDGLVNWVYDYEQGRKLGPGEPANRCSSSSVANAERRATTLTGRLSVVTPRWDGCPANLSAFASSR